MPPPSAPAHSGFSCTVPSCLTSTWPRAISGGVRIRGCRSPSEQEGAPMRRVVGVIACAVLMLIATSARLSAQGGTVRGRVADTTGAPLARVSVSIEAIGARATTNEQGEYEIRGVPAGTHSVRARLLGYVPQIVRVTVSEAQPARQDFALHTQPIGLAPVDVVVGSRA